MASAPRFFGSNYFDIIDMYDHDMYYYDGRSLREARARHF